MGYSPDIFRSYDIRGIVPEELDESAAERIGRAFVTHTGANTVVVGRDMRQTGEKITAALKKGILQQGARIFDIGLTTSPLFYVSVWKSNADAGVMVTASHNPGEYNGFKMTREKAVPIAKESGLLEIRSIVERDKYSTPQQQGDIRPFDVTDEYLDYTTTGADSIEPMTIIADTGNGMAGMLLDGYVSRLPRSVTVTGMYTELDGSFPNHEANPLKPENIRDIQARVVQEQARIGVAFDGDGDRVGFIDEQGNAVSGDFIGALLAVEVLAEHPGAAVLYDLRSSRAVPEAIRAAGGIPVRCRVGHSYIKKMMRDHNAVFAAELSSHFYFGEYYAESSYRALTLILRLLSREKKQLSELVTRLQKYAKTDEINFHIEDKDAVITEAMKKYSDGKQDMLDGLTVEYPDWWFNLRVSGTEPLLRLNMEADTRELLEKRKQELYSFLGQPE